ncbi:DNA topoisomerase (ATP-hydrolyzing) [Caenorhabditis elegans]|nr:DNA topoisomerase (ATP-hydrolyzing) [Caenorhabditis elegans]CDR32793.1 DNA topoisomerase (ATP-hydrolyzing) [Caenorhabditis elegans]|eukprot:NP_001294010.1 Meiotic recombination protein spo-11 [Caenorhabditis elegans]
MRKIEFALADIKRQMDNKEKSLTLRISTSKSHFCLRYTAKRKGKLDRDLHCLHQVYDLLENDKRSTKRELYYEHKAVYGNQKYLDSSIKSICELLNESRANLNILSCGRGIIRGAITFLVENVGVIDARVQEVLITDALLFSNIISEADFILVVEKDTTFQKLMDENFQAMFPRGILATSKGYPDIATRNVLKMLSEKRKFPIYGLFDADPHGIEIYLTYKYGPTKEFAEGRGAFVPTIEWIGLFPTDFHRFTIDQSQCLPLVRTDFVKIEKMIPRSIQLGEIVVTRELDWMIQNKFKMELESINMCGQEYMARFLIAPRVMSIEKEIPIQPETIINEYHEDSQCSLSTDDDREAKDDDYIDSDAEEKFQNMIDNDSD